MENRSSTKGTGGSFGRTNQSPPVLTLLSKQPGLMLTMGLGAPQLFSNGIMNMHLPRLKQPLECDYLNRTQLSMQLSARQNKGIVIPGDPLGNEWGETKGKGKPS